MVKSRLEKLKPEVFCNVRKFICKSTFVVSKFAYSAVLFFRKGTRCGTYNLKISTLDNCCMMIEHFKINYKTKCIYITSGKRLLSKGLNYKVINLCYILKANILWTKFEEKLNSKFIWLDVETDIYFKRL